MSSKKRQIEDGDYSDDEGNSDSEKGNSNDEGNKDFDNGGGAGPSGPDDDEDESSSNSHGDRPEKKKFRINGSENSGTLLFTGGTNWDLIGRRELPKTAKGATGRNLWGFHKLTALNDIRVRTVASGNAAVHTIIITEDGQAMSWGRNDKGQLGHGDTKRRDNPTIIETVKDYVCVDASCGRSHSLILTDRGNAYGFGDNKMGQCGIGNNTQMITTPTRVLHKGRPLIRVCCGAEFSMIIDIKGHLFSFGCPEYGQLGHNSDGKYFVTSSKLAFSCELSPKRVGLFLDKPKEGLKPIDDVQIAQVACGINHVIAMDTKGRCFTWGFGGYGRLGHSEPKDELIPRLVRVFDGGINRRVKQVYAGGSYCLAVNEHGALYFWGQNKPSGEATMYPKPVNELCGWKIKKVGCSNRSIVVVSEEGVTAWGASPTYGELGYGENKKSSTVPQEVKSVDGMCVHDVACGYGHTLLIVRDEKDDDKARLARFPEFIP